MISERQFNHLSEMGVTLYKTRTKSEQKNHADDAQLQVSADDLLKSPFFNDVIKSLSLTLGEISLTPEHINLGLFNWYFHSKPTLSYNNAQLITPPIEPLTQSSSLKRELWHIIYKQIL